MDTFTSPRTNQPKINAGGIAERLNAALDRVAECPPKGPRSGREAWLARRFKVSQPSSHAWLNGNYAPSAARARTLARMAGVSFDWLYFGLGSADATSSASAAGAGAPDREDELAAPTGTGPVDRQTLRTALRLLPAVAGRKAALPEHYAEAVLLLADLLAEGMPDARAVTYAQRTLNLLANAQIEKANPRP